MFMKMSQRIVRSYKVQSSIESCIETEIAKLGHESKPIKDES